MKTNPEGKILFILQLGNFIDKFTRETDRATELNFNLIHKIGCDGGICNSIEDFKFTTNHLIQVFMMPA